MLQDKNKYLFGVCKVNDKGQIVIPKSAREVFNIQPGDALLLFGDKTKGGMALVKTDVFNDVASGVLGGDN